MDTLCIPPDTKGNLAVTEEHFGWKRVESQPSDHTLAAFLRRKKAIDNYQSVANSVTWYEPAGKAVAVGFYSRMDYFIYTHTGTLE